MFDPRYEEFFVRFNRQEYFEAHEVLEELWLQTTDPRREFYKGLIQTAAALLKVRQGKPDPARRIADRARTHLQPFAPVCEGLDVRAVVRLLEGVPDAVPAHPRLELDRS